MNISWILVQKGEMKGYKKHLLVPPGNVNMN